MKNNKFKLISILLTLGLFPLLCACSSDSTANAPAALTIEARQTDFAPAPEVYYALFPNDVYHAPDGSTRPSETNSERAWNAANEFVFRTALRNLYALPGFSVEPGDHGYTVRFKSTSGGDDLRIFVTGDASEVKIKS